MFCVDPLTCVKDTQHNVIDRCTAMQKGAWKDANACQRWELTLARRPVTGGWGLQVLSVTFQSPQFCPALLRASLISGTYCSGRLASLHCPHITSFMGCYFGNSCIAARFAALCVACIEHDDHEVWSNGGALSSRQTPMVVTQCVKILQDCFH